MLKLILNFWKDKALLPASLLTLLIIIASLINPASLPQTGVSVSDKTLHFFAYFFLALTWMMVGKKKNISYFTLRVGFSLFVFGIILEVIQGTITQSRTADWHDVLANFLGILGGIFVFSKLIFSKLT